MVRGGQGGREVHGARAVLEAGSVTLANGFVVRTGCAKFRVTPTCHSVKAGPWNEMRTVQGAGWEW